MKTYLYRASNLKSTITFLAFVSQLKPTIKVQISGRMALLVSDVVTASVYSEKTHLEKLMMMKIIIIIISIMNKLQETTVFHGRQKLTSAVPHGLK